MDRPLEIAFHNLQSSESVETEIRRQVERLETRYGNMTSCRVSVEALHQQHQTGNLYEVHISVSVRGKDLAVSQEPHHAKERYAHPDVHTTLRDAFKAIEKQLSSASRGRHRGGSGVAGAGDGPLAGQVALIDPGSDHGFLIDNSGTQLYFHRDSVTNGRFETMRRGDLVHYVAETTDTGPVATKVRLTTSGAS